MRIGEIMSTPVIAVTPNATIDEAIEVILSHGFTTLPVVGADGTVIGTVTEADLALARFSPDTPLGAPRRAVAAVMRTPAAGVSVDGDVSALVKALIDTHLRCVPVIRGRRVVGMVSWRDLLQLIAAEMR